MDSFSTEAVVLKRRNFGEADRLVTFFTRRKGKITVLAKGVRKITSRRSPNIEQLNRVKILVHETKGLPVLSEADSVDTFHRLKKSLERLSLSYLILELVDRFLDDGQEVEEVFDLLVGNLAALDACESLEKSRLLQSSFQIKLMTKSGYLPQLYHCVKCANKLSPNNNFLSPHLGGLVDQGCNRDTVISKPASEETIKTLRFLESEPFTLVKQLKLNSRIVDETVNLLNFYTVFFLERELNSLEFASQVTKLSLPSRIPLG